MTNEEFDKKIEAQDAGEFARPTLDTKLQGIGIEAHHEGEDLNRIVEALHQFNVKPVGHHVPLEQPKLVREVKFQNSGKLPASLALAWNLKRKQANQERQQEKETKQRVA